MLTDWSCRIGWRDERWFLKRRVTLPVRFAELVRALRSRTLGGAPCVRGGGDHTPAPLSQSPLDPRGVTVHDYLRVLYAEGERKRCR
jgi:hypothetical protein